MSGNEAGDLGDDPLRRAALDLIGAGRRFLDAAERHVNDSEAFERTSADVSGWAESLLESVREWLGAESAPGASDPGRPTPVRRVTIED